MRDSSGDLPAKGSPEPKREAEVQSRPREGLQWPQEKRSPPLPLPPDMLAARGRLSHGRLFAFSTCVSGGSLPNGPGGGGRKRTPAAGRTAGTQRGSPRSPQRHLSAAGSPPTLLFSLFFFFPPRSRAEPRSLHPHPPAPKSSAASTHPSRKGRFDREGHGYVRAGDKNKAGKEGGRRAGELRGWAGKACWVPPPRICFWGCFVWVWAGHL